MEQVTRRDFVKTAAATTILLGTSRTAWAGANDRVRVAQMGLNGRGKSHLGGYAKVENVEAAKKYKRIVQHGTQLRSNPGFQEGIKLLHDGALGKICTCRCVCYKWRPDIGKGHAGKPPAELDWNIWQGPAQEEPFTLNAKEQGLFVHYNWHWHWAYGNGDIGNQGSTSSTPPAGGSAWTCRTA